MLQFMKAESTLIQRHRELHMGRCPAAAGPATAGFVGPPVEARIETIEVSRQRT